jgi:fructose-bisphosphate aldolase, class II
MPLVSIAKELKRAQQGKYAIPLYDTFESLGSAGIFAAINEKKAPCIVAVYTGILDRPDIRAFVAYLRQMAAQSPYPVSLMLDHGASFEHCVKALALGLSDVMFDGSKLPLEENIARTRLIVQAAHAAGASCEAELGHVGQGTDYLAFGGQGKGFTNPDEVERFVAETGVDSLAVAIGSAHGVYHGEPHLELDLLAELRRRVETPLVMHGGSGLSDEQFRSAIAGGISKINIFTDLAMTSVSYVCEATGAPDCTYQQITTRVQDAFKDRSGYYLDLFGATGKG